MATGDEHYRIGEELLEHARVSTAAPELAPLFVARAQAHFTAALVAATIDAAVIAKCGTGTVVNRETGGYTRIVPAEQRDGLGYGR